jgi:guanylate kinase
VDKIKSVDGGTVRTINGKTYKFPSDDKFLEHTRRGGYIESETVNRGTERFTIYNSRRKMVAEGERTALSEIS